ncbi:hypothetical protein GA0070609_3113 [Micromonospora echinaurantiaca]|uniref:Uncharacterized protein n=1 Tax=Micromonospora echinaurantiaca TaxID=47857 RepID=A0A1C5IC54_9ACTN|nr:hypothetical protein GA0070609_3113 [Micromonospora echinaurantiaca]
MVAPPSSWSGSVGVVTASPVLSWSGPVRAVATGTAVVAVHRSRGRVAGRTLCLVPGPCVAALVNARALVPSGAVRRLVGGGWAVRACRRRLGMLSERLIPPSHQYAPEVSRSFLDDPTHRRDPIGPSVTLDETSARVSGIRTFRASGALSVRARRERAGPVVVSPMWRCRPVRDGPISATWCRHAGEPSGRAVVRPVGGVFVGFVGVTGGISVAESGPGRGRYIMRTIEQGHAAGPAGREARGPGGMVAGGRSLHPPAIAATPRPAEPGEGSGPGMMVGWRSLHTVRHRAGHPRPAGLAGHLAPARASPAPARVPSSSSPRVF